MTKSKIKIIYIITKARWGGAQKYVFDLASSIPTDKFDVSVIFGKNGKLKEKLLEKKISLISLPHMQRNINIFKEISTFFSLYKILKLKKPNILHLNSSKAGGIGALAGRFAGIKKIIFTGHGWAFNENRSWLSKLIITFFYWLTIMLCHKTIAVSEKTRKQFIKKMPFVSKKIIVIHNGIKVNKDQFYSRSKAQKLLFQKTKLFGKDINMESVKTIWIGTIAELHENKNINIAIKAIKNVSLKLHKHKRSLVYFIMGEGGERKKLEKLIKENNLETEVFLVGKVDDAIKYLKGFDIFLFPSKTEALPYVLLEAGLAGLPVIAGNVGGIPEIIENMKSGILVSPKKHNDIENAIISLLLDNNMQEKMAQALRKKIETEFKFDKMLEKTLKLYYS